MAFRYKTDLPDLPTIYNVTMAVGDRCANAGDDVMLVQLLLRYSGFEAGYLPNSGQPLPRLKIDGKPSQLLFKKIFLFQQTMRDWRGGHHIKTDGRVDPAVGSWNQAEDAMFTIIYLNRAMKDSMPSEYGYLDEWDQTPSLLKGVLRRKQPRARRMLSTG